MTVSRRQLNARALAAVSALAAPPLVFAEAPPPSIELRTRLGVIVVALAAERAPITCANFLRYVDEHRFDGASFYRAMRLAAAPPAGLVQGGLQNDPARILPPIAHESTAVTGLRHRDGTLSMARYAPGTAASEFFVCVGDQPSLDADPSAPGDNAGFAAFGQVTSGKDVVRAILAAPTSPTKGEGEMKGQMLEPPIPILSARRVSA